MARLCWAMLLVRSVPFRRWQAGLGLAELAADEDASLADARQLAADVEWAARRLPLASKCLPRAMVLSWMLRRKRIGHSVVVAVRPNQLRQSPDALHAWVEIRGTRVLGDLPGPWVETLRLG